MPTFSPKSKLRLSTCDLDLQRVLVEAIKHYDFSVVCGYRDQEAQDEAYENGFSTLKWPYSNHNVYPSGAVDIIPYPSGYEDEQEFYRMATYILAAANKLGVKVRWGGHWKNFKDLPHFELYK